MISKDNRLREYQAFGLQLINNNYEKNRRPFK